MDVFLSVCGDMLLYPNRFFSISVGFLLALLTYSFTPAAMEGVPRFYPETLFQPAAAISQESFAKIKKKTKRKWRIRVYKS